MTSNTLSVHHHAVELAAKAGPAGPVDVAKLYVQTGILAYDAAHRSIASQNLADLFDVIATLVMFAGGLIIAIAAASFIDATTTGITPTQRSAVASGAVVGALIMATGLALTSFMA